MASRLVKVPILSPFAQRPPLFRYSARVAMRTKKSRSFTTVSRNLWCSTSVRLYTTSAGSGQSISYDEGTGDKFKVTPSKSMVSVGSALFRESLAQALEGRTEEPRTVSAEIKDVKEYVCSELVKRLETNMKGWLAVRLHLIEYMVHRVSIESALDAFIDEVLGNADSQSHLPSSQILHKFANDSLKKEQFCIRTVMLLACAAKLQTGYDACRFKAIYVYKIRLAAQNIRKSNEKRVQITSKIVLDSCATFALELMHYIFADVSNMKDIDPGSHAENRAFCLQNLALLYAQIDEPETAAACVDDGCHIMESQHGGEAGKYQDYARLLMIAADNYLKVRRYAEAKRFFTQALDALEMCTDIDDEVAWKESAILTAKRYIDHISSLEGRGSGTLELAAHCGDGYFLQLASEEIEVRDIGGFAHGGNVTAAQPWTSGRFSAALHEIEYLVRYVSAERAFAVLVNEVLENINNLELRCGRFLQKLGQKCLEHTDQCVRAIILLACSAKMAALNVSKSYCIFKIRLAADKMIIFPGKYCNDEDAKEFPNAVLHFALPLMCYIYDDMTETGEDDTKLGLRKPFALYSIARLCCDLKMFQNTLQHAANGCRIMEEVYGERAVTYQVYGKLLSLAADCHYETGKYEEAKSFYEKALTAYEKAEDIKEVGMKKSCMLYTKRQLSLINWHQGKRR